MTAITKASAKRYFAAGAQPTSAQFSDLIDSYQDAHAALSAIAVASTATGYVEFTATGTAIMRPVGAFGRAITSAASTAVAIGRLGLSGVLTSAKTGLVTVASGQETTVSFNIPSLTTQTSAASTDQIVFFDVAASAHLKTTRQAFNKLAQRVVVLERTADISAATLWTTTNTPTNTIGMQVVSAAITPTVAGSIMLAKLTVQGGNSASAVVGAGIFVNADASAASIAAHNIGAGVIATLYCEHEATAPNTSVMTFRGRVFSGADRVAFNRTGAIAAVGGGASTCSLVIEEYIR